MGAVALSVRRQIVTDDNPRSEKPAVHSRRDMACATAATEVAGRPAKRIAEAIRIARGLATAMCSSLLVRAMRPDKSLATGRAALRRCAGSEECVMNALAVSEKSIAAATGGNGQRAIRGQERHLRQPRGWLRRPLHRHAPAPSMMVTDFVDAAFKAGAAGVISCSPSTARTCWSKTRSQRLRLWAVLRGSAAERPSSALPVRLVRPAQRKAVFAALDRNCGKAPLSLKSYNNHTEKKNRACRAMRKLRGALRRWA